LLFKLPVYRFIKDSKIIFENFEKGIAPTHFSAPTLNVHNVRFNLLITLYAGTVLNMIMIGI